MQADAEDTQRALVARIVCTMSRQKKVDVGDQAVISGLFSRFPISLLRQ